MNIGMIGAGMIGETLARRLAQLGHQIRGSQTREDHRRCATWRLRLGPPP